MDSNYILLQEDTNSNYEPTDEEVREEAKYLGIAPEDSDMMWIAREALLAPLPRHWNPYQHRETGSIVYYNKKTGVVSENHPMDAYFRGLYHKLKDDPISSRIRSVSNSFVPELEPYTPAPLREARLHPFPLTSVVVSCSRNDTQSKLSAKTLDVPTPADSALLVKAIRQATVEINLYNEWLDESVRSLKQAVDKIGFLESRMKSVMKTPSFATSA